MCMCAYTSPIVLLMETQPNPAFDEPFVSWTYMYLKGRRASLFFVRTTLMATLLHTARALFVFGGKMKKKKKEEKQVLASGMHPVLSAVMLFFSSPPLTFITPIKISLSQLRFRLNNPIAFPTFSKHSHQIPYNFLRNLVRCKMASFRLSVFIDHGTQSLRPRARNDGEFSGRVA